MKKTIFVLLIALICAASIQAQTNDWQTFTSEKGKFSILVPVIPTEEVGSGVAGTAGSYTTHLFTSKGQGAIYMVGWADYKPGLKINADGELKANRDNFLKGVEATLLSETKITLDKNPGIEFKAEKKPDIFIKSRVYMVGNRPYQLIVISFGQEDSKNTSKFLNSFKLTTHK
jgi:hypothetical protein